MTDTNVPQGALHVYDGMEDDFNDPIFLSNSEEYNGQVRLIEARLFQSTNPKHQVPVPGSKKKRGKERLMLVFERVTDEEGVNVEFSTTQKGADVAPRLIEYFDLEHPDALRGKIIVRTALETTREITNAPEGRLQAPSSMYEVYADCGVDEVEGEAFGPWVGNTYQLTSEQDGVSKKTGDQYYRRHYELIDGVSIEDLDEQEEEADVDTPSRPPTGLKEAAAE